MKVKEKFRYFFSGDFVYVTDHSAEYEEIYRIDMTNKLILH